MFQRILAALMSLLFTLFPTLKFAPKNEDILLNVSVISDTHIDYKWPIGEALLRRALKDISSSSAPVDAVVVSGDLTNYGDKESMGHFFELFRVNCLSDYWIIATGNHDIGHVKDVTQQEARERFIGLYNEYTGSEIENIYYSKVINGYRFIVMGDQGDDTWDESEIHEDQLEFLDSELSLADGKPVFVICHQPLKGTNGQGKIWGNICIGDASDAVLSVIEKYSNVFFISGHSHVGINGELNRKLYGFCCVETINGVNYINLPTYTIVNRHGFPWGGLGMQLEVYEGEVIVRARSFLTSDWYDCYEFNLPIV